MKKKVYIISHSHWDREWYMAYEQHHMRLIELIDDLLELFEVDPSFNSFHLDGQTIILDDYLQVRPEKRQAIQQAINEGKLRIGPFYILQDDFLISSESNVRNMLIGMEESRKWGTPVMLGYFPDTFGNMGQTPQLMKQAGISAAAFGRGVKPIGFDNQVLEAENYSSQYSEMWWKGPDQTAIFGLLFANWYSNGNEIPVEKEAALAFWKQKLADAEQYASTNHLLMMNGVDHQPVQKDISKAIYLANELFPDYEFIHSNFTDYLEAVQKDVPEDLGSVEGELTSQETDGWYTLANTASARVYLKQWNTKVQRQLENITEPLATMAYEVSGNYPHDQLDYAWKTLMQNHPHDSICGCSVDSVHREMIPRFEKADEVGKYLAQDSLEQLTAAIDTTGFPKDSFPFVIVNTAGMDKTGEAEITIELERKRFAEGIPEQLYQELENLPKRKYHVETKSGATIPAILSEETVQFGYDLPKDRFRVPYMARMIKVTLPLENMPAFSWETFALVEGEAKAEEKETMIHQSGRIIENGPLHLTIEKNGTITMEDRKNKRKLNNLHIFEDIGDIGNEYIFKQPFCDQPILSSNKENSEVKVLVDTPEIAKISILQEMEIPVSADERLEKEQQMVVEFRYRKAERSKEKRILQIKTIMTIRKDSKKIDFETTLDNQMKDHRLRVLFPTKLHVEHHEADSIFEVVKRPNHVSKSWENPTNPQHQQAFVNIHDEEYGVTVGNFGLNEYEVTEDGQIAVTLLRSVGELGDWGYFPTPEAQCLGEHRFNYSIELHGPEEKFSTYLHAYAAQIPFSTQQIKHHEGTLISKQQYLTIKSETFAITALKRSKFSDKVVVRGFNMSSHLEKLEITKDNGKTVILNLLEEPTKQAVVPIIQPYEIRTIGFEEENECMAE
ncbi:alpha-mannosidase [Enterococcus faecium]|uniref:Glycosyl hydrolase n=1 Tax=Enterococcus faecium 10/96A TaxID=1391465 RepID=A0AAV3KYG6_ENTFC|nr:alpha-mannosidase [Enterococcus faecium]EFF27526.1 glycosyl hydrolase, family 38 [Enterococcus faecium E1679]ELB34563.1 glycosyl hydrolase [Enterococcus faecium EnGen0024]ERT45379.1 glycosyl hydrolase [Enterococcus faecium 10/96A]MBY3650795.1 alpha-mannosidase [Enterococcus faecium]VFA61320.1 glycosyl hydrolase family 38 protein [Enterococcus faecium]